MSSDVPSARAKLLTGPWNEDCDLPVLLDEGIYEAVYVRHEYRKIFDKTRLILHFRITEPGQGFRVLLPMYFVVTETSARRWTAHRGSRLARTIARLFPSLRRPCLAIQGALKELLKGKLFLVRVVTVKHDYRQQALECGYSKIDEILKVC